MTAPPRQILVQPDTFEVVADDAVLSAEIQATLAVCVYDAVEEPGALLHLRFIARGDQRLDVTDRTLATDLLLLDRCIADLRAVAPRAQHLQGKIAAHVVPGETAQAMASAVIELVSAYLRDAGVSIVSSEVNGGPRRLKFRPAMGQVQVEYLPG
jgi:chemotaxis receptor (MCP) glutamine deamidase CheD